MTLFVSYLVAGLAVGCSYALVASGFVAAYRVTGVVNFAQGSFVVLAALASASLGDAGVPHGWAEAVAIAGAVLFSVVVGLVVLAKPGMSSQGTLVLTLAFALTAYSLEILLWGDQPRSPRGLSGSFSIGGAVLPRQQPLVVGGAVVVFTGLWIFFEKTYLGKALTACATDAYAARLAGINVRRMGLIAFALAGALGGLAGVLIGPLRAVAFDSDVPIALNGFAAAVFGGLTRLPLALAGAVGLGVAEELVGGYGNATYENDVALAVLLAVMIVRAAATREAEISRGGSK